MRALFNLELMIFKIAIVCSALLCVSTAFSQKGIPPKEDTEKTVHTSYPTHMEYSPSLAASLKTAAGWTLTAAATGLGKPRMLYVGSKGQLYVTRRDAGDVLMLTDKDNDGKFEDMIRVADFPGVHGITVKDNHMYLCNSNQVLRYAVNADGTLGKVADTLIKDLPSGGQHPNRTMDFGPDGKLYISVGSVCNDCKESDKETAALLQVDPVTWKRTIYASGLRNTIGFDWHPQTKELWGMDNGGDFRGDDWPPEELNHIVMDGNYGFPFAYGKQEVDQTREDPVGNTKENMAKASHPSVIEFPAHSAPIAFTFFEGGSNKGNALVCWHGSWNREKPSGYKVELIKFDSKGNATGSEDFLSGFLKGDERFGRPAGVAIAQNGTVYISDDANGVIYALKQK
ncbi:glucose dehydrogenase [Flavobacterium akiainvivens]|jgi:glucose/arabinose dehydrogenase|uniref:Glucose dehydrogenase n=2 Tax=Flavobacterium akiainvivens TaxID=1202724 RepID=A0A0M8MGR9_9FLAO|nr:glucose dehydrogenase [Flavobacterium akiainvivens]SFQ32233.1 Glucose/arabinose dehydrogenase, beta-propeller fold [Flavobacterium akiainvivens]